MPSKNGLTGIVTDRVMMYLENGEYYPQFSQLKKGLNDWPDTPDKVRRLMGLVRKKLLRVHQQLSCCVGESFYKLLTNQGLPKTNGDAKNYLQFSTGERLCGLYVSAARSGAHDYLMAVYIGHHNKDAEMSSLWFKIQANFGVSYGRLDRDKTTKTIDTITNDGLSEQLATYHRELLNEKKETNRILRIERETTASRLANMEEMMAKLVEISLAGNTSNGKPLPISRVKDMLNGKN